MRVLIVDDDRENVEILADTLVTEGFEVGEYTSPVEALKSFSQSAYDVVISDIRMPEIDGLQLLETIKQQQPSTRVIMVTGFASMENAIEALNKGACRFYRKPLDARLIVQTLRNIESEMETEKENLAMLGKIREGIREVETIIRSDNTGVRQ